MTPGGWVGNSPERGAARVVHRALAREVRSCELLLAGLEIPVHEPMLTTVKSDPAQHHDVAGPAPAKLLEDWRTLVEQCERGYEWNAYEYHNDLSARDRLQEVLVGGEMEEAERAALEVEVAALDARFRALLQEGVQVGPEEDPWWHRGVVRYAGSKLVEDLREWFGVEVTVQEQPR